jgi:hypothetical protein
MRSPQIEALLEGLRQRAAMSEPTARMLLEGSDHPYTCRCETCLAWWVALGPEDLGDERKGYGPFTEAEIKAAKKSHVTT